MAIAITFEKVKALILVSLLTLFTFATLVLGPNDIFAASAIVDADASYAGLTSITKGSDGFPVISYYGKGGLAVVKCGNVTCTAGNVKSGIIDAGTMTSTAKTSIAIGTDNLPVVAYILNGSPNKLKVVHCGNASCSSGNQITTISTSTAEQDLAIGSDGLPVVSFHQRGTTNLLKIFHCGNVTCTAGNTTTSPGYLGRDTSIAIGTDGFPVVSFSDRNAANTQNTAEVLHCGNVTCTSGNTATEVYTFPSNTGPIADGTSLAIGTDSNPVFAFYPFTSGTVSIHVIKCNDPLCTTSSLNLIANSHTIAKDLSLTVDPSGNPLISYQSFKTSVIPSRRLSLVTCSNSSCSTVASNTAVDSGGWSSQYGLSSSITIGSDNLPVISHYDAGPGTPGLDLRVYHP